jgi:hypothetical protein
MQVLVRRTRSTDIKFKCMVGSVSGQRDEVSIRPSQTHDRGDIADNTPPYTEHVEPILLRITADDAARQVAA